MPLWGNGDSRAQTAIFAPAQVKIAPNTANRVAMFNNATADAFLDDVTIGLYGCDDIEIAVARAGGCTHPQHTGHVLVTTGSGNRAGRIQMETLVAMSSLSGDTTTVGVTVNTDVNATTLFILSSGNTSGLAVGETITDSSNLSVVNTGIASQIASVVNATAFTVNVDIILANGSSTLTVTRAADDSIFPDS